MTQRLPIVGGDSGDWGTILNGFLEVSLSSTGTLNSGAVGNAQLQTNSVGSSQLQSGSVTTTALASNAVGSSALASNAVGTTNIASGAVTDTQVSSSAAINPTKIAGTAEVQTNKGVASGYAPLNSSSLVPTTFLGTGSASSSNYLRGDGTWTTAPSAPVSSVFTRTGAVTATTGDYSVSQITGAAPLASPALTGTPTAPTNSTATDASTQIATDAFVQNALAVASVPPFSSYPAGDTGSSAPITAGQLRTANSGSTGINYYLPSTISTGQVFGVQRGTSTNYVSIVANAGQSINGGASGGSVGMTATQPIAYGFIWLLATSSTTLEVIAAVGTDFGAGWDFAGGVNFQGGVGFNNAVTFNGIPYVDSGLRLKASGGHTSSYTTLLTDLWVRATSGSFTITMGTTSFTAGQIQLVTNEGTGTITLAAASGTIDLTSLPPTSGATLSFDGTNWHTVGSWNTGLTTSQVASLSGTYVPVADLVTASITIIQALAGAAPSSGTGQNGDWVLDSNSGNLWGPKASGAWPGAFSTTILMQFGNVVATPTVTAGAVTVAAAASRQSSFTVSATTAITISTTNLAEGVLAMVIIRDGGSQETLSWVNTENTDTSVPLLSKGSTSIPLIVFFRANGTTTKWSCVGYT